jgi:hypothetical protein
MASTTNATANIIAMQAVRAFGKDHQRPSVADPLLEASRGEGAAAPSVGVRYRPQSLRVDRRAAYRALAVEAAFHSFQREVDSIQLMPLRLPQAESSGTSSACG